MIASPSGVSTGITSCDLHMASTGLCTGRWSPGVRIPRAHASHSVVFHCGRGLCWAQSQETWFTGDTKVLGFPCPGRYRTRQDTRRPRGEARRCLNGNCKLKVNKLVNPHPFPPSSCRGIEGQDCCEEDIFGGQRDLFLF